LRAFQLVIERFGGSLLVGKRIQLIIQELDFT